MRAYAKYFREPFAIKQSMTGLTKFGVGTIELETVEYRAFVWAKLQMGSAITGATTNINSQKVFDNMMYEKNWQPIKTDR